MKKDFNIFLGDDYPDVLQDDSIVLQSIKRLMESQAFEIPFWRSHFLALGLSRGQLISDASIAHAKDVLSFEFHDKEPRAFVNESSLEIQRYSYRDVRISIEFVIKETENWYKYTDDLNNS